MSVTRTGPGDPVTARCGRRVVTAVTVVVLLVLSTLGASALPSGDTRAAGKTTTGATEPGSTGHLVTIGDGRSIYLQCQGTGSPTVVLVSGTGGASDEWTHVVDPAHPAGPLKPSRSAVLPTVASSTRVCAYDRPGTTRVDGSLSPSTRVPQPTTAKDGVADLEAVLRAAGEHPPYVLVGASWGAMITTLFARTHPTQVTGLVTVDGASQFLKETLTPDQWSDWMDKIAATESAKRLEVPDYESSVTEIRNAPALPHLPPAVALTSDQPWDLQVGHSGSTWPAWLAAQQRLASDLHARHITHTDSGHGISVEQPQLVAHAIRAVGGVPASKGPPRLAGRAYVGQ
ncbi:alpha/beta fold hydrolase [Streptomyces sp. NPDC005227]|uniref:alpha/beta fold hydrolase n=1 Tax=Streptomyces sp. NPDC005227 TaxID=3364707 RepID=UPI0036B49F7C